MGREGGGGRGGGGGRRMDSIISGGSRDSRGIKGVVVPYFYKCLFFGK